MIIMCKGLDPFFLNLATLRLGERSSDSQCCQELPLTSIRFA
jgi:hypothetical protein